MSYIALYRKYRPRSFSEVVGQEDIVQTLRNAVVHHLLAHAYIFSGPRGSGKTTMARILAKAANCQKPEKNGDPCNACKACGEIAGGRALDLIEIDAASNRGIDDIRELREGVRFAPSTLTYKVFVIDEAHQLSRDAANALLKILEEPPSHAIFVLATTELQKMIPTILSRCQRFEFRRLRTEEIALRLEEIAKAEGAEIGRGALNLIASHAEGAMRDGIGLLDKVLAMHPGGTLGVREVSSILGMTDREDLSALTARVFHGDAAGAVEKLHEMVRGGGDAFDIARDLVRHLRALLIIRVNPGIAHRVLEGVEEKELERMVAFARDVREEDLKRALHSFMEAESRMKYTHIPELPLELAIVDVCGISAGEE